MEKARGACNKSHGQQHPPGNAIANSYRFPGQASVMPGPAADFGNIVLLLRLKRHTKCIKDKALHQCYQIIPFGMAFLPLNRARNSIK
jgi:hypothetical protein